MLTVSIIVHGDYSHIDAALHSLHQQTSVPLTVHLTINTGPAPDVDRLRAAYPAMHIHLNDSPRGFAANHNAVLRLAQTPFVALLNDDVIFAPGALDVLVGYLQDHPDAGMVGPLVRNPDGSPQLSTFSDPSLLRMIYRISGLGSLTRHGSLARRLLQRTGTARLLGVESLNTAPVTREVPVVVGVCMVVRQAAYREAGVMDEDTRVYGEEFGWQWRLRRAGWRVVFVPDAVLTHYNPAHDLTGWKLAEHRKSIICYYRRYRPRWQAALIRLSVIGFHGLWALLALPFAPEKSRAHRGAVRVALRPDCCKEVQDV